MRQHSHDRVLALAIMMANACKFQYFTPELNELRIGDIAEEKTSGLYYRDEKNREVYTSFKNEKTYEKITWRRIIVDEKTFAKIKQGLIRVPYLIDEQIIAEGWEPGLNYNFIKNDFEIEHRKNIRHLIISHIGSKQILFAGRVPDINTFRNVIKMLFL